MQKSLISWIGGNDLDAVKNDHLGPILRTLQEFKFDEIHLLFNYPENVVESYITWLSSKINLKIFQYKCDLSSPINFGEIYEHADLVLSKFNEQHAFPEILLSPGTPAMQAVWILLGKTKYPTKFIQASLEQGVQNIEIPFQIAAEYTPSIQKLSNQSVQQLQNHNETDGGGLEDIKTQNPIIKAIKKQAAILSGFDIPVLITGETGTGKELFARAIHHNSTRAEKPFIAVNCGALPEELVDSLLFGHKRGAFTGAQQEHLGFFREADGGTIFLDEFGDLPAFAQVKLLRVLQEGIVTPIGSSQEIEINVRVIAATHKNLIGMIADGTFREDLFYRISVGVLNIPPLRDREGDLLLLADEILNAIKTKESLLNNKYFSVSAKNIILQHSWPGNVREMQSTIMRAALWSTGDQINDMDLSNAIINKETKASELANQDIGQGIDINNEISVFISNYIRKALSKSGNNKTKAAQLLGLKNYQTLNNWIEKYGID